MSRANAVTTLTGVFSASSNLATASATSAGGGHFRFSRARDELAVAGEDLRAFYLFIRTGCETR